MVKLGQGLFGKLQFSDGSFPEYDRPYLVVDVTPDKIGLVNVSSTKGKEHKLFYHTNRKLIKYKPPFLKDSFIKLDSLTYIPVTDVCRFKVLHNGQCLDNQELNLIIQCLNLRK